MSAAEPELVHRAMRGDRDALTALLVAHGPALRRSLQHEIPSRWQAVLTADDVLQETYTDAFLDIAKFVPRDDGSFGRWLATIARNNLLNALQMLEAEKRGGGRRRVAVESVDGSYLALYELVGATSTTPSRIAAGAEARAALTHALLQLPEDYRTVVQTYDLEGQSIEEVCETLRRRSGAIYMLRARAHRALARLMGAPSRFWSDVP